MPTLKSRAAVLSCSIPMELTSMKQWLQPFSTILAIRELIVIGSEVVFTASLRSSST